MGLSSQGGGGGAPPMSTGQRIGMGLAGALNGASNSFGGPQMPMGGVQDMIENWRRQRQPRDRINVTGEQRDWRDNFGGPQRDNFAPPEMPQMPDMTPRPPAINPMLGNAQQMSFGGAPDYASILRQAMPGGFR